MPISSGSSSAPIDLKRVRSFFAVPERSAESDFLRREIAKRMEERLSLMKIEPGRVIDAGCGAGADLAPLQDRFAAAQVVGVDASEQLLAAAKSKQTAARSSLARVLKKWLPARLGISQTATADFVCADFAQLPLAPSTADLLWSNLALHWHPRPDQVFAEWRRVLRVDGLLMFSCFGPDTFKELRMAFAAADGAPHALSFVDMHDFGDMLVHAGFATPVMDMEVITVIYDSVEKLIADTRAWGGNPLQTRRRGLLGKDAWRRVREAFEQIRRTDGKIPLTFEIIYGHAFRAAPSVTASGESIIRLDLQSRRRGTGGAGQQR